MTVGRLIELLQKAVDDGAIDPKGEILASTVNGCHPRNEETLMETVEETKHDGFYMLSSLTNELADVVFYTAVITKEEETA